MGWIIGAFLLWALLEVVEMILEEDHEGKENKHE